MFVMSSSVYWSAGASATQWLCKLCPAPPRQKDEELIFGGGREEGVLFSFLKNKWSVVLKGELAGKTARAVGIDTKPYRL